MSRALLLAAFVALAAPGAADAHAVLSSSSPGYRERFERPPREIVLSFSQVVQPIPNGVVVREARGRAVSHPARLGPDGRSLVATVRPLARGAYTVRWQTLSVSDGHVVSGLFTFGVATTAPAPTEAVGAGGPTAVEKVVRWLSYLGLAVLAGGLALRLLALPPALPERLEQAFLALMGAATLVLVDAGIAAVLLRADAALQLPIERFLYADLSPFVSGTRFGLAWVWMTLGSVLAGCLIALAWLRRSRRPLWPALAIVLAVASGFSLSGHSASEPNSSPLTVAADWLHIAAASLWIGGLVVLAVIGWRLDRPARRAAFLRFSRLASVLVGVVVLAGVYLGLLRLSSPGDLWSTEYGRVLLLKLALVGLALAWGAAHHLLVRPRLESGAELPGGRVGRSLAGESVVGVTVLLVAAFLANTEPP